MADAARCAKAPVASSASMGPNGSFSWIGSNSVKAGATINKVMLSDAANGVTRSHMMRRALTAGGRLVGATARVRQTMPTSVDTARSISAYAERHTITIIAD